jgi:hypothetical protein
MDKLPLNAHVIKMNNVSSLLQMLIIYANISITELSSLKFGRAMPKHEPCRHHRR